MTAGLTHMQSECLGVIVDIIDRHNMSPTFEEIRVALGVASKSSVNKYVKALTERGFITHRPGCARSIQVLQAGLPDSEDPLSDSNWVSIDRATRAAMVTILNNYKCTRGALK